MLNALKKPVASPVQDNVVTVSFSTGPNLVSYDYTIACYATNDAVPTTDCGAVAAAGIAPVVPPITGTLPRGYAEVSVEVSLPYLNPVVDCLVTVDGGPVGKAAKCQYARPSGPAVAPTTAFVVNSGTDSDAVLACPIEGTGLGTCTSAYSGTLALHEMAITGSTAYITRFEVGGGGVLACSINDDNELVDCADPLSDPIADPTGIAISGSTVFINSFIGSGTVTGCQIAENSVNPQSCTVTTGFNFPNGIAIIGSTAFVANEQGGTVSACAIDGTSLVDCTTAADIFTRPAGIAFSGATAYVTDVAVDNNAVYVCTVDGTSLVGCVDSGATELNYPDGIAISGQTVYLANYAGNTVTTCTIGEGGALVDCANSGATGPDFNIPYGVALY